MSKMIVNDAAFECELQDDVAIVRLTENALRITTDLGSRDKFLKMLDELESDPRVSGLIQINNEAFSGEAEISNLMKRVFDDAHFRDVIAQRFRHSVSQIVSRCLYFQKPIVTGVSGPITMDELGGYLMSDRLVVSDHFSIRNPGLNRGLPPGPVLTFLLPRMLGPKKALKLLTEDDPITAPEALDMGLVDKIVPEAQFEQECKSETQRLARLPSPVVSATRELIFSQFDKFGEHLDRSIRQKMQIIKSTGRP